MCYKYNPSGSPSLLVFITLSRAARKSAICTLILRSRRAISPASEQIALMSAPERSSFWLINSSRSTSSLSDIFDVCNAKILRLVFSGAVSCCAEQDNEVITHGRDSQTESFDLFFQGGSEQDPVCQSCWSLR